MRYFNLQAMVKLFYGFPCEKKMKNIINKKVFPIKTNKKNNNNSNFLHIFLQVTDQLTKQTQSSGLAIHVSTPIQPLGLNFNPAQRNAFHFLLKISQLGDSRDIYPKSNRLNTSDSCLASFGIH